MQLQSGDEQSNYSQVMGNFDFDQSDFYKGEQVDHLTKDDLWLPEWKSHYIFSNDFFCKHLQRL